MDPPTPASPTHGVGITWQFFIIDGQNNRENITGRVHAARLADEARAVDGNGNNAVVAVKMPGGRWAITASDWDDELPPTVTTQLRFDGPAAALQWIAERVALPVVYEPFEAANDEQS
jgi:hypothetical protein